MMATRTVEFRAFWLEWRHWILAVLAGLIVLSAVSNWWSAHRWQQANERAIKHLTAAQDTVDMARHETKVALAKAAAWEQEAEVRSHQADVALGIADKARRDLEAFRRRPIPSSIPGTDPSASDTVRARDEELRLANQEISALRATVVEVDGALAAQTRANVELKATIAKQDSALAVAQKALAAGVIALAHAQAPCRILFLHCPSRVKSAAVGLIGGALAVLVVRR